MEISIGLAAETLHIEIKDDGIGLHPEELETLLRRINEDNLTSGESYGLKNVNQRIRLFYGKQYGISIESQYNIGTTVRIVVPAIES